MNKELRSISEKWEHTFSEIEISLKYPSYYGYRAPGAAAQEAAGTPTAAAHPLMKELVVLHESHEQMMAQLAQTHAQTVDQGNALQGALQQIGQLQTVVQRLESSINQVLQRHEAAASRFKTMQDEMNFTRAECDALQVRAAAAEERAQDALDARTAREDELLSLQQRLERMQAERDQISKAFIQFRMEMLTKKQQEERNAASLPAGEDRP